MKVAVLSSVYGAYDEPAAPIPQDVAADWVLVTDRRYHVPPWRVVYEPRPQLHPRLAAKVAKCRPGLYTDADVTVWVDASVRIVNYAFVRWAVEQLGDADIALIRHPDRKRLSDEADVSAQLTKYHDLAVLSQVARYLADGHPDGWGLWAAGIIVRRAGFTTDLLGDRWLAEQVRWTYQDQLSLPPILRQLGMSVADLPIPLLGSEFFQIRSHRSDQ